MLYAMCVCAPEKDVEEGLMACVSLAARNSDGNVKATITTLTHIFIFAKRWMRNDQIQTEGRKKKRRRKTDDCRGVEASRQEGRQATSAEIYIVVTCARRAQVRRSAEDLSLATTITRSHATDPHEKLPIHLIWYNSLPPKVYLRSLS